MSLNINTQEKQGGGTLHIVATPLGNAKDLSERGRETLEQADFILAEDSKRAGLACARWDLCVPKIISVHEHNEEQKVEYVLNLLQEGKNLALISDAGMPILSDPGYLVVKACREAGHKVIVIPGACAPVTALAGSGIAPQPFIFFGFLPRKRNEKEKTLSPYRDLPVTLIFFERKDRVTNTLEEINIFLGRREICIARELTKVYEEYIHFYSDALPNLENLLGEITIIVGPPLEEVKSSEEEIIKLIESESQHGGKLKEVAKRVQLQAKGWKSSDIYTLASRKQK